MCLTRRAIFALGAALIIAGVAAPFFERGRATVQQTLWRVGHGEHKSLQAADPATEERLIAQKAEDSVSLPEPERCRDACGGDAGKSGHRESPSPAEAISGSSDNSSVSVLDFPCPSVAPVAGRKLALFVYLKRAGTSRIRGDMMAGAFKTFPGWDAMSVFSGRFPKGKNIAFCVLIKFKIHTIPQLCKRHGAKVVYWDILDGEAGVKKMMATVPSGGELLPPEIDIVLSPDRSLTANINQYSKPRTQGYTEGWKRGFTLYHQHTNFGVLAPAFRFNLPYICRVAVFVSSPHHSPNQPQLEMLANSVCKEPNVWTFAILRQVQDEHKPPNSTLDDYRCEGRPKEMTEACTAADAETIRQHWLEISHGGVGHNDSCFKDQIVYNYDVHNRMVDVAVVAAEGAKPWRLHRPVTRVVTWMSYGVPVLFTSGFAYDELTKEWKYTMATSTSDASNKSSMSFPRYPWPPDLECTLYALSNATTRMAMREHGLAIAAEYTAHAVASRLLRHFEHHDLP